MFLMNEKGDRVRAFDLCDHSENILSIVCENAEVFAADLKTHADRGIRRASSFGAWLDGDYAKGFGDPPVAEYGAAMLRWKLAEGRAVVE
jgi:hypothetical protein